MEGCASLLALDAKRAMRPVLAAHRDRAFRPGEVMNAGPIRFVWTRGGESEPWAAVPVSLELGPTAGARVSPWNTKRTGARRGR